MVELAAKFRQTDGKEHDAAQQGGLDQLRTEIEQNLLKTLGEAHRESRGLGSEVVNQVEALYAEGVAFANRIKEIKESHDPLRGTIVKDVYAIKKEIEDLCENAFRNTWQKIIETFDRKNGQVAEKLIAEGWQRLCLLDAGKEGMEKALHNMEALRRVCVFEIAKGQPHHDHRNESVWILIKPLKY